MALKKNRGKEFYWKYIIIYIINKLLIYARYVQETNSHDL